jgi:Icc-related predicted phosphoesterase
MKIAAFSDTHGCLGSPDTLPYIIAGTDVIVIAGDIIPLEYQRDHEYSMVWFRDVFLPWAKSQPVERIIFIGGNHDRYFEQYADEARELIDEAGLSEKVIYLFDESYTYNGKVFYGTPWIENLKNWSFYTSMPYDAFSWIPECDVLISHTPPRVEKVGCSYPNEPYEANYGSFALKAILEQRDKVNTIICGHIHTGTHGGVKFGDKTIYNVSMVDEDYREAYNVTYIEI